VTLELPIFFHSEETRQAKATGMPYHIGDCKYRLMTFYAINMVSDYIDDDDQVYTEIHANGEILICPLKVEEVRDAIAKAQRQDFMVN
jgi:hypothetical protein